KERLRQLAILEDEEEVTVPDLLDDASEESFELCAVGTFVTDKTINFVAMKTQLAKLWKPGRGVTIEDKGEGLYLFRFFHEIHLRVRIDVRKALKIEKEVKKTHRAVLAKFQYERLPTFCYLCGRIGHIDRFCELHFHIAEKDLVLLWDEMIRAPKRQVKQEVLSPWLVSPARERQGQEARGQIGKGAGRSRGGGGGQWRSDVSDARPANIRALAVNFWASPEFKDKLVEVEKVGSAGEAIEIQDDRKRRRSSGIGNIPMEVDKEN
ncbi:hypothetical protein LINPERHAP1_LOCUS1592, partial [Linum perenne]